MKINIEIHNPFEKIQNWFLYNPIFWKLKIVKISRPDAWNIGRIYSELYLVRHIVTGKILVHNGWGKEITQTSIYNVNERYDLME